MRPVYTLHRTALAEIIRATRQAAPEEACGLLFGADRQIHSAVATANVADDPLRHFEIDPVRLIAAHRAARAGGLGIVGYFHSHPNGLAQPSATDQASAAGDGRVWAIVARGRITLWKDAPSGFEPLSYDTVEG
ncbi:Mov34/MPN/PAD-1 family protein [Novosphingobium sp.]|uniref:Mov34/MPN/PAD-1 family protein n=1 Tax=Novosphingobium sp. TaxID=1874826 RepID=UPI00352AB7D6